MSLGIVTHPGAEVASVLRNGDLVNGHVYEMELPDDELVQASYYVGFIPVDGPDRYDAVGPFHTRDEAWSYPGVSYVYELDMNERDD